LRGEVGWLGDGGVRGHRWWPVHGVCVCVYVCVCLRVRHCIQAYRSDPRSNDCFDLVRVCLIDQEWWWPVLWCVAHNGAGFCYNDLMCANIWGVYHFIRGEVCRGGGLHFNGLSGLEDVGLYSGLQASCQLRAGATVPPVCFNAR